MNIPRRKFLSATTAGLVLPSFQKLGMASEASPTKKVPTRSVFLGMGFGVSLSGWFPSTSEQGSNYELPPLLAPLARHKAGFSVIQNLSLQGSRSRTAAHSGSLFFLSDASAVGKASTHTGLTSCDQIAAQLTGQDCRFPSLVLKGDGIGGLRAGHGGGMRSLSWNQAGRHMSGTVGALKLYEQIYGQTGMGAEVLRRQLRQKKSVLDMLVREMKSLNSKLSPEDREVLDQYTTSLREVEVRLTRSYEWSNRKIVLPEMESPPGNLSGIDETKLTYDLIVLAFQADLTRVVSYMMPTETMLSAMDLNVGVHEMSHYRGKPSIEAARARDLKHAELLAYFFDKLKAAKQADGQSLFDHSMIAFGSVLRTRHGTTNGPMIFAGHGGGGLRQGLNVVNPPAITPLTNLWFSMLRQLDETQTSYSSSKNIISEIFRA